MARLIDELKRDHVALNEMLTKLKDGKVTSQEAHKILLSAQAALLAHLKKEDAQLYPVLNKAAQSDLNLKRTIDFYAKDMDAITATAVSFFQKYASPNASLDIEFAKALGRLFCDVSRRLRSEENTLYKSYEAVHPL